jgi:hypothetical protein
MLRDSTAAGRSQCARACNALAADSNALRRSGRELTEYLPYDAHKTARAVPPHVVVDDDGARRRVVAQR